ncbi:MAG: hypothetical protein KGJ13_07040 [Patescibacteria group bacterium]|nr:hypothetical protein [Patescibacteria group bacterium]
MKNKLFASSIIIVACAVFFVGCGTITKLSSAAAPPNPAAVSSPSAPAYIPNPSIPAAVSNVQATINALTPAIDAATGGAAAPVIASVNYGIAGLGLLATTIAGLIAGYKNKQAGAHAAAAAALAATVTNAGQQAMALNNAAQNGSSATVAQHLADAANPVQL